MTPDLSGFDDPNEKLAAMLTQSSTFSSPPLKSRLIVEACRRYNLDGVFWLIHYACRPIMADADMMKDMVQKELDIPFMVVEGDVYDAHFLSAEALRPRIETFAERVKARQAGRA
ncbi:MAG: 2-hydroxyacyl-CoA dehydratase family protein [Dehalococcoidia bacterium]|nr:2-hydroxyacyl-CoA dehydratase family protein [Dehalococcoidia bacterium]